MVLLDGGLMREHGVRKTERFKVKHSLCKVLLFRGKT
jgi:hypothetical protein